MKAWAIRLFPLLLAMIQPASAAARAEDDLLAKLMANETALWNAWIHHDNAAFAAILAPDVVQIVPGAKPLVGRELTAKTITSMSCTVKYFTFHDAALRKLSDSLALVTYYATQDSVCGGHRLPNMYASALYVRSGDSWLLQHYQQTPAPE